MSASGKSCFAADDEPVSDLESGGDNACRYRSMPIGCRVELRRQRNPRPTRPLWSKSRGPNTREAPLAGVPWHLCRQRETRAKRVFSFPSHVGSIRSSVKVGLGGMSVQRRAGTQCGEERISRVLVLVANKRA